MLAAFLLLASRQSVFMPKEYLGVWATSEGQFIVLNYKMSAQMDLDGRHMMAG